MTDEGSFLLAILAQPDDADPRLLYADWLEEYGDPRAEILRLAPASVTPSDLKASARDSSLHGWD